MLIHLGKHKPAQRPPGCQVVRLRTLVASPRWRLLVLISMMLFVGARSTTDVSLVPAAEAEAVVAIYVSGLPGDADGLYKQVKDPSPELPVGSFAELRGYFEDLQFDEVEDPPRPKGQYGDIMFHKPGFMDSDSDSDESCDKSQVDYYISRELDDGNTQLTWSIWSVKVTDRLVCLKCNGNGEVGEGKNARACACGGKTQKHKPRSGPQVTLRRDEVTAAQWEQYKTLPPTDGWTMPGKRKRKPVRLTFLYLYQCITCKANGWKFENCKSCVESHSRHRGHVTPPKYEKLSAGNQKLMEQRMSVDGLCYARKAKYEALALNGSRCEQTPCEFCPPPERGFDVDAADEKDQEEAAGGQNSPLRALENAVKAKPTKI